MKALIAIFALFAGIVSADIVPQVKWDIETGRLEPRPYSLSIRRGESLYIEPRFTTYNTAINLTGASIEMRYSTAYNSATYYLATGSLLAETGRVHIAWNDALCPTNDSMVFEIRATLGTNILARGYGPLTFLGGMVGINTGLVARESINWSTISQLGGVAVLTNQMGTGATWSGSNWTFASAAIDQSWSNDYYRASNPSNYIMLVQVPADDLAWTNKADTAITNALASTNFVIEAIAEQAQLLTYYVLGSSNGPVSGTKYATLMSSALFPSYSNTANNVTNGQLIGAYSVRNAELPNTLQAGVVAVHANLVRNGAGSNRAIQGILTVVESNGVTVVQAFTNALPLVYFPTTLTHVNMEISVPNAVDLNDGMGRMIVMKFYALSGWAGTEDIQSYSQDGYTTRFEFPGSSVGIYTLQSEFDSHVASLGNLAYSNSLTDNRTDSNAWHYGDSVTGAVDSVARGLTNYDAYGSALAVSNSFTNAASKALTAWQNPASATNWGWTSDGTQITLTNYTGPNAVVIPDMFDGLPVTSSGGLFNGSLITSITGNNIKTISGYGFYNCFGLTSVSFPKAETVDIDAFAGCTNLTSVSLPLVTSIGNAAFQNCYALTSLSFSQNVLSEGSYVLSGSSVTNYVTNPTATGWGATWNERPVVRLPLYGSGSNLTGITAEQVGALSTNGGALNGAVTTVRSNGWAGNELITADGVRGFLASGKALYMTTNVFNASWQPTNSTTIGSYEPTAYSTRFSVGISSANQYIATMVDTNPIPAGTEIVGPATVVINIHTPSGGGTSLSVKPEIYYTYNLNATSLTLGDFDAAAQAITVGATNAYTWSIAFASVVPTSTYYRVYRLKTTAKGNSTTTASIGMGGSIDSFVLYQQGADTLGERGATNIVTGAANGYDSTTRTLTYAGLTNVSTEAIVAAGAITNWLYDPVLVQSNINASLVSGTCTLTRTMGNCLILATNIPLVIDADATLTAATIPALFWLDLFAGTNQVTWITTAITNASTTALSTTATNNLIFVKGTGATILKGKVD